MCSNPHFHEPCIFFIKKLLMVAGLVTKPKVNIPICNIEWNKRQLIRSGQVCVITSYSQSGGCGNADLFDTQQKLRIKKVKADMFVECWVIQRALDFLTPSLFPAQSLLPYKQLNLFLYFGDFGGGGALQWAACQYAIGPWGLFISG